MTPKQREYMQLVETATLPGDIFPQYDYKVIAKELHPDHFTKADSLTQKLGYRLWYARYEELEKL